MPVRAASLIIITNHQHRLVMIVTDESYEKFDDCIKKVRDTSLTK